jgi:hypothetical protein
MDGRGHLEVATSTQHRVGVAAEHPNELETAHANHR